MKDLVIMGRHAINPEGVDHIEKVKSDYGGYDTMIYFRGGGEVFVTEDFDVAVKCFQNSIKKIKRENKNLKR